MKKTTTIAVMIGQGSEFEAMGFEDMLADKWYCGFHAENDPEGMYISAPVDTEDEAEAIHAQFITAQTGSIKLVSELVLTAAGIRHLRKTK